MVATYQLPLPRIRHHQSPGWVLRDRRSLVRTHVTVSQLLTRTAEIVDLLLLPRICGVELLFAWLLVAMQIAGVATLEGQNVSYDLLMANVDGVSVLLMEDVSPLPAADVIVAGVSSATVNMMDSAVLTGSAIATSSISYYGSDVSITVATDQTSSVTRLGPSRP